MQTSTYSSSGTRYFKPYAKPIIASVALAFVLMLLIRDSGTPSIKINPAVLAKTNFTSVVNKMYDATNRINKNSVAHALNAQADTNQLKQSDWFKAVQKDIEKRMYYAVAEKDGKTFRSINGAQSLKATYSPDEFSLCSLPSGDKKQQAKNNWELKMVVNGLYADDKLIEQPADQTSNIKNDNNDVEYNFGNAYAIQYRNDSRGVRQNFVVREKPSSNAHELKVSLKIEGDWVVNKVHDRELHFAKTNSRKILENKITYNDLKAWDANGKALAARMEVKENNNFEIITEVSNAVYPVTIDPLSTSPSSTLTGTGTFGNSVASAGDVNGDGYSDVIVGAATASSAYIFLGSASGLSASPATTLTLGIGNFGFSVASAGDINGDGFSDVIVGDFGGNAYVFQGSSTGVSTSPATSLTGLGILGGNSVANAGDVNGDGFSDVIIGSAVSRKAFVYPGSASGLSITATTLNGPGLGFFGTSVASAGDINGDGFSDVIVGDGGGNAYIYLGGSTPFTASAIQLTGTNPHFAMSVSSAGDVNGDGYSDVIIGDGGGNAFIFNGSASAISSGSTATANTSLSGGGTNLKFGVSVAGAGDVNGDAYSDVIVGDSSGNAFVYLGSASGLSLTAADTLTDPGTNFGISVASAGDVNGDGYSDLIVGAYTTSNAFTYQGSPTGSVSTNTLSIAGQSGFDRYGISVSSAGDINGDGYSDVIVGAIGYSGGSLNGAAYVYLGSASGLSTASPSILTPGGEEVGWDVAAAGDIDGDGYGDIVIGAKFTTGSGGPNQGVVYIFRGNSSGVPTLSATLSGLNMGDVFGESISGAGDVNGDGYSDIIIGAPGVSTTNSLGGAAYLYMGSAAGILSTDVPIVLNGLAANAVFGANVANAGDVNGDGYGDIIIGAPNLGSTYDIQDLALGTDNGSGIGSAYVFYGSKTGIVNNATADVALTDAGVVDFGISVSSAGDVNGDGFSDVIVGAPSGDNTGNPGTAEIFLGGAGGLSTTASPVLNGLSAGDEFGATVATAGDVNGDGYSDVIIRATMPSLFNPVTGAAYIYLGGPTGLSSTIATTISDVGAYTFLETPGAGAAGNIMHRAVASAGDVNGDGFSDVIVGVYVDNIKTGKTYLYYGNNSVGRNASNVLKLYETDLTNPIAADNLTKSDFGLGLFVQSPFGTVKGRLVWETEPNGTAFNAPLVNTTNIITNSVVTTGKQTSYTSIQPLGTEFKSLIPKSPGKATKVRVRIQYASTAVTFGQAFSPWIYSQVYLLGGNLGVLPLDLLSLTATTSGQDILINWKTAREDNMQSYVVEHSLDAGKFDSIGEVAAKGNIISTSSYDFTHYHPTAGVHYYRLKEVDKDGRFKYSQIVSAKINGDDVELSIYPNPASDHIVITHKGIASNYVRIMNAAGSVVGQYKLDANSTQTTISLKGFAKGNYFVDVVNSGFAPKQIAVQ